MALKEFDFLQSHDDDYATLTREPPRSTAPTTTKAIVSQTTSTNADRNNKNLMRPVLTMPPVLLMGAPQMASPIVEMPPSPAPSQMPMVEYPTEDDNMEDEYVDDAIFDIEVG